MENFFNLVYVSQAHEQVCYTDIQKILVVSQKNNIDNNVTGLLLYQDHHFLQILEGDEDQVMLIMARVIKDRRNHHLRVLIESQSNKRIFESFPMVFYDGDTDQSTSDLVMKIFATALDKTKNEKEILLQMLQCFRLSCPRFQ